VAELRVGGGKFAGAGDGELVGTGDATLTGVGEFASEKVCARRHPLMMRMDARKNVQQRTLTNGFISLPRKET
jgi:hypothetical protein